ncbi:MAG TPA: hypothetical protein VLM40_14990, partial [Gemmata sp.]|nr:hypothetical protein [Gemmata sp.]
LGERVTGEDAAATRLFALQPGLEVETEPLLDLDMQELASLARELFVLRPRDRAIRRNEWLLANASRHDHFRRAAKALKQSRPAIAALEPTLMARLSIEFGIKTFAKAANRPPIDMPRFSEPIRSHPFGQPEEAQLKQGRREQSQEPASRSLGCGGIWLGIVILGAIRACLSGDSHRSEPPPPTFNPEQLRRQLDKERFEQYEKRTIPGPWMRFTEEQVRLFQAFDQDRRGVAPPWYGEWVRAGRPSAREAAPVRPPRVQDDEKEP